MKPQVKQLPIGDCSLTDDVLKRFLAPSYSKFDGLKQIISIWNYRGNGTKTEETRTKQLIGESAFAHYQFDTIVCNGKVLLMVPRFRHPEGVETSVHFPTPWFWCMSQVESSEDVCPATAAEIARVPEEIREQLKVLPELHWYSVLQVNFFRDGKPAHQAPPEEILFFQCAGGLGLAIAPKAEEVVFNSTP